jgi:general transcription factor 3C polypeptide 3 (transcription factor C subunit 4)
MNPRDGYYNQWPIGQPPNGRRFVPISGTFGGGPAPQLPRHANGQAFPAVPIHQQGFLPSQQDYPQPQAAFTPLIPMSAIEDLQLPQIPFTSAAAPETFSGVPFVTSGPVVHEGYIPAPGRNEEDVYPALPPGYGNSLFRDRGFDSSDDESNYERELTFEEQMLELEVRDNSEIDKDYSEEDAEHDEGDPDEMELGVEFEDEEERAQRKRGKPVTRGSATQAPRGGHRGRPRGRGRGGFSGSISTRGRNRSRGRGRGRPKGIRHGPRKVADPGEAFKELQRQANERFIAQDYPAALEYAQKAIQMNPEIFDAHNIASEIYAAMGEEVKSIDSLIIGAPTKRDPGLWHFIIERVNKLDEHTFPEYTEDAKTALTLRCLQQIVLLDNQNYEARSNILEIEASLGHVSKCVKLGRKMLKLRKEKGKEGPDTEVLKIMAMMGTSNKRQTKLHLSKLLESFDDAIEFFLRKKPDDSDLDWEMINIYLDLVDRNGQYEYALTRLKTLARWKQGRIKETYWDELQDDREFDIEDGPRRIAVPQFKRKTHSAKFGTTLPLEIRVKLGIFRLRKSPKDFQEAMVGVQFSW